MSIFTFDTKNIPLDQFEEHDPVDGLYKGTSVDDIFYTFIAQKPVKWKLTIPYQGKQDAQCLVEHWGSIKVLGYPSVVRWGCPVFYIIEQ